MSGTERIVIVGAGQAGGRAAETLRAAGFQGSVVLVGEEPLPPYERPPLSKDVLGGKAAPETTFLRPAEGYAELGIELRLGMRVNAINPCARQLRLADGSALPYDRLLLATGAHARRLAIAGADSPEVHYVRDMADSLRLRTALRPDARVLIIGAGFIGLEVAATARAAGCAVTIIESAPHPLARVATPEIGAFFADLHRAQGVDLRMGSSVTAIEPGTPSLAYTNTGETIEADVVVIGVGAVPNTELAEEAGLEVADGIVTDSFGRTSDPAIFAAGDATRHLNPLLGRHIRLEAWQNAQNQAIAAARTMAGQPTEHAEIPWFWTDQYEVNMQFAGAPLSWDQIVWRGPPTAKRSSAFLLREGIVVGGICINNGREMRPIRQLIATSRAADPAALADPAVKLVELAAAMARAA
ncbi:NAD(P)/FAD-dependent oxidoreductase [Roseomonas harenae]|uniref:NAD(P)/FAD-dependent oxidoreductase n=1 Tax=Muricoccus harenae TaxID=2692566 RepID=UPI001331652C|nr:FAD-dependent oxidoreductase [Roseomonas harenae]